MTSWVGTGKSATFFYSLCYSIPDLVPGIDSSPHSDSESPPRCQETRGPIRALYLTYGHMSFAVGEAVDGVPHVGVGGDDDAVGNCDTESQGGLVKNHFTPLSL